MATGIKTKSKFFPLAILACVAATITLFAQEPPQPVPRGQRVFGMDINVQGDAYETAFKLAKAIGVQAVTLSLNWDEQDLAPGKYNSNPNWPAAANVFFPPRQTSVILILRPVDTNGSHIPADLRGKALSDPIVVERFKQWIDHLFAQMPNVNITLLAIGNEVDLGLGNDAKAWEDYEIFYRDISRYVHQKRPEIKVGVVATLNGLAKTHGDELEKLNQHSDWILLTYYPLEPDFSVKDAEQMDDDLEDIMSIGQDRALFFTEVGCPTATSLGSSLERQAQFIDHIFTWWDQHPDHVVGISFSCFANRTQEELVQLAEYYHITDRRFIDFVESLGLCYPDRTFREKAAFQVLRQKTTERGWVENNPETAALPVAPPVTPPPTASPEIKHPIDTPSVPSEQKMP